MTQSLLIIAVAVLALQIVMFILIRRYKKSNRDVAEKYKIKTRNDAWKLLNQADLLEEDRTKIQDLYSKW